MILFNSQLETRWLSNFHICCVPVKINGKVWNVLHVEAAYQFSKTADRSDEAIRAWFGLKGHQAKQKGKTVEIRPDWDKLAVMELLCRRKFTANAKLRERLLLTFDEELVHLSPWDLYWGVNAKGKGENHLGKIIMKLRDERSLFEKDW